MNNIRKYTAWLGAGAIMITLASGCADRNDNGQPDSMATTEEIANTTKSGVDATENSLDAAGNNLDEAGTAVANTAMGAGDAMSGAGDAAIYTPKIKTALGANAAMEGSKINVDTMADKKEIALSGTVKSSAQMTMAEAIAKKNAPADYTVVNQLTMEGKM